MLPEQVAAGKPPEPLIERRGAARLLDSRHARRSGWLEMYVPLARRRNRSLGLETNAWEKCLCGCRARLDASEAFEDWPRNKLTLRNKHVASYCEILEDKQDATTGHVSDGTGGRSYGGDLNPLPPLAEALKTHHAPNLDLSHLRRAER